MPDLLEDKKTRLSALKAVREGRVSIRSVAYADGMRAVTAAGLVRGYTGRHEVTYMSDRWQCTCDTGPRCPHVLAVQLVTGHASAGLEGDQELLGDLTAPPGPETSPVATSCSTCWPRPCGQPPYRSLCRRVDMPGPDGAPEADTECRHGMTTAFCADCTGRDGGQGALEQERTALLQQPGWTRAAFGGRCARCGEGYATGEPIRAVRKADQSPGTVWAASCCQDAL